MTRWNEGGRRVWTLWTFRRDREGGGGVQQVIGSFAPGKTSCMSVYKLEINTELSLCPLHEKSQLSILLNVRLITEISTTLRNFANSATFPQICSWIDNAHAHVLTIIAWNSFSSSANSDIGEPINYATYGAKRWANCRRHNPNVPAHVLWIQNFVYYLHAFEDERFYLFIHARVCI